jgi:hypothetical protein
VDTTKLTNRLSLNERAVEYLEKNEHLIHRYSILFNLNAIHIIEKNFTSDPFGDLSQNRNMVNYLRNNRKHMYYPYICCFEYWIEIVDELLKNDKINKIEWGMLSRNPAAMHIINDPKYYKYIDWKSILYNKNAIEFIKKNMDNVKNHWSHICKQPHLIDIIEQNMDKIDWVSLSENDDAIHILLNNIDKANIDNLRHNKNGFPILLMLGHTFNEYTFYHNNIIYDHFDYCTKNNKPYTLINLLAACGYTDEHLEYLKKNKNEIHYYYLSCNPNIFEYDYKRMRETRQALPWYNNIKNMYAY